MLLYSTVLNHKISIAGLSSGFEKFCNTVSHLQKNGVALYRDLGVILAPNLYKRGMFVSIAKGSHLADPNKSVELLDVSDFLELLSNMRFHAVIFAASSKCGISTRTSFTPLINHVIAVVRNELRLIRLLMI